MNSIVSRVASGSVLNSQIARSGCADFSAASSTTSPCSARRRNTARNSSSIVRK